MKELDENFKEYLGGGLREDVGVSPNTPRMELMYNLRAAGEKGAEDADTPAQAISTTHTEQAATRLLVGESQVMVMDTIGGDMVAKIMLLSDRTIGTADKLTTGTIPNMMTDSGTVTPTTGHGYSFVEVDGIWFITNGAALITNVDLGYTAAWNGGNNDLAVIPTGLCMYNDRFVACGLNTTGSFFDGGTANNLNSLWTDVWSLYKSFEDGRGIARQADLMDDSYVMIGTPGGGSSDLPFAIEQMLFSGHESAAHGHVRNAATHGEIVFVRVPWNGNALAVQQLGDNIIVYGDTGVGLITPIRGDTTRAQVAVEYFKIEQILDIGILNKSAHIGDKTQQTFIDTRGDIWRINAEGQLTRLGYKEFISPLTAANVLMSQDIREGDIYIGDGSATCYQLSPFGLSKARYIYNDILPYTDGALYGVWVAEDSAGDVSTFTTVQFNFGNRQYKVLQEISIEQGGFTAPTAKASNRFGHAASFTANSFTALNFDGSVFQGVQGSDFKLLWASGAVAAGAGIDDITLFYKVSTKRRLRDIIT